jgi:hypothetical protein
MKPLRLPPDTVLRAYMDLLGQVFLFLRGRSRNGIDSGELFALADALHNVPELLTDYGAWVNDTKFRELYLRPFDERWAAKAFSLEEFLDRQLQSYARVPY